jgi:hypothetical protein
MIESVTREAPTPEYESINNHERGTREVDDLSIDEWPTIKHVE